MPSMPDRIYSVEAHWDPEAAVWVATSLEIPGLATEASTLEKLAEKLRIMVPELLAANGLLGDADSLAFELVGHREERVLLAS